MRRIAVLTFCLFSAGIHAQTIPVIGTDTTIDIANWNLEWYGSISSGPSDEALQQQNAVEVIEQSAIDIWALCEISDPVAWDTLLARLPEFGGVMSTWSQTQKTALLYKKSVFRLLYSKNILAAYDLEFASGRLPMEVGLEVNLGSWKDTIYAYVIHLKANIGTAQEKAEAWEKRRVSSEALRAYVEASGKWKKSIILGDWNDDVDTSILTGYSTPFTKILNDTNYFFPSRALSLSGKNSTASYPDMIDHQCVTKRLRNDLVGDSASVFYLQNYITGYATSTSDHYPVYTRYILQKPMTNGILIPQLPDQLVYWNGRSLQFNGFKEISGYTISDLFGRCYDHELPGQINILRFMDEDGKSYCVKIWIPEN